MRLPLPLLSVLLLNCAGPVPRVRRPVDSGWHVLHGRTVNLVRKTIHRPDGPGLVQGAFLGVKDLGFRTFAVGPAFVPELAPEPAQALGKEDSQSKLTIFFSAHSPAAFEERIRHLPDLQLETPDSQVLSPTAVETSDGGETKIFTYAITAGETPWFIVRSVEVPFTSGDEIQVPELKFILIDEAAPEEDP